MSECQTAKPERARFYCFMCGKPKVKGLFIRHGFLCARCESELVKASVDDPAYDDYVTRVKKIWPDVALLMHSEGQGET